jgi:flagellar biosynthesis protein FliQ
MIITVSGYLGLCWANSCPSEHKVYRSCYQWSALFANEVLSLLQSILQLQDLSFFGKIVLLALISLFEFIFPFPLDFLDKYLKFVYSKYK